MAWQKGKSRITLGPCAICHERPAVYRTELRIKRRKSSKNRFDVLSSGTCICGECLSPASIDVKAVERAKRILALTLCEAIGRIRGKEEAVRAA